MTAKEYIRDGRAPIPKTEVTSKVMSANKDKNTKPELVLRKELWSRGLRGYRLHWKKAPEDQTSAGQAEKLQCLSMDAIGIAAPNVNCPYQSRTLSGGKKNLGGT